MLKLFLTAFTIPFLITVLILIKNKYILKRDLKNIFLQKHQKELVPLKNILLAFVLTFTMMCCLYFTMTIFKIWTSQDTIFIISRMIGYIFAGTMFYLIIYTNKINKYRKIIFILFAIGFSIDFLGDQYEARQHLYFLSTGNIISNEIPQCQIGLLQNILPAIFFQTCISPGKLVSNGFGITYVVGTVFILWLAVTLAIGRGWCSWACFWGGWDDGFSSGKKSIIKNCSSKLKLLPFAILIVILISSLVFMTPTYCWWLCPFKSISEAPEIISSVILIQTIFFITLFLGLAVILPFLTKKRTLCTYLCPFGAFQSIADKINLFTIKVDKDKCVKCKKCIKACPVMALDENNLEKGKTGFTCIKCGKCIDACPQNALFFHIRGVSLKNKIGHAMTFATRYIFIFIAFIFLGTIGAGEISDGLYRIILFLTTGSFVQ